MFDLIRVYLCVTVETDLADSRDTLVMSRNALLKKERKFCIDFFSNLLHIFYSFIFIFFFIYF